MKTEFIDRRENLIEVLKSVHSLEEQAVGKGIEYLETTFINKPKFIETVKNIIEVNKSHEFRLSSIVTGPARDVLALQNPFEYIGKNIGGWVVEEVIHHNKKSIILQATAKGYSQKVAIKVISPFFQPFSGTQYAAMQAQYMSALKHPNMVEVKSCGTTSDNVNYVVMELLTGHNIAEHCKVNELSLTEILKLFLQVCEGVANMHINLVVHCDLKPENIILDSHDIPKIIDLDLSHSNDGELHEGYEFKNIVGHTNEYASPEKLNVNSKITLLSDIYSLGIILCEIALGGIPSDFKGELTEAFKAKFKGDGRCEEFISIVNLAIASEAFSRYQSVSELSSDISDLITRNNIVKAYQKKASLVYKISFSYKRHFKMFNLLMVLFFIIITFTFLLLNERNVKEESISLMLNNYDPTVIKKHMEFDRQANRALRQSWLDTDEHFKDLIKWGDTYYWKGLAKESIKFYMKALSLYPDRHHSNHIVATTKLALAHYNLVEIKQATSLLRPYVNYIFQKGLSEPIYIKMLLAAVEIDSKFRTNFFENQSANDKIDVLSTIDVGKFTDESERLNTKVSVLMYKAIHLYTQLSQGDYASRAVYQSEEIFQKITKPKLIIIKKEIENVLWLIKDNQLSTHMEGFAYIWLGYIAAELREYAISELYSDNGIIETIRVFGIDHPRTTEAYNKRFGSFRYFNTNMALKAVIKADKLSRNDKNKEVGLRAFSSQLLVSGYLYNGDFKGAEQSLFQLIDRYEDLKVKNDFDIDAVISALNHFISFRFVGGINTQFFIEMHLKYEKIYALEYNEDEFLKFSLLVAKELEPTKDNNKGIMQEVKLIDDSDNDDDVKMTDYLKIAEICQYNITCDALPIVNKAMGFSHWNENDNAISIEKLLTSIRIGRLLKLNGEYVQANSILDDVKFILDRNLNQTNLYVAIWHKIKSDIMIGQKDFEKALYHADIALPAIEENFGKASVYYKELLKNYRLINLKNNPSALLSFQNKNKLQRN